MDIISTFMMWLNKSSGKPQETLFRNRTQAIDFVRRLTAKNSHPNRELKLIYSDYQNAKKNGLKIVRRNPPDHDKTVRPRQRA